ncbi:MAG TPA: hypothetical protein DC047_17240 [Blastocatellia bacterium]|nr:hypothetical protein [Blastocatellia bacterium]
MKPQPTPSHGYHRTTLNSVMRIAPLVALVALIAIPLFSSSSASSTTQTSRVSVNDSGSPQAQVRENNIPKSELFSAGGLFPLLVPQATPVETVTIYQSNCSTPQTDFVLGQTVCAKLTNAPLGSRPTQIQRRLSIVGPGGYIRSQVDVSALSSTATLLFPIPADETSIIGGDTIDNRGAWQAVSNSTRDGSTKAKAGFTVTDSDNTKKVADLFVTKIVSSTGDLAPSGYVIFTVFVANGGPDPAENVEVRDAIPANTTFFSEAHSDASFTCTNPSTGAGPSDGPEGRSSCTTASLARGAKVKFTFTYKVDLGTPVKTEILNVAQASSSTPQRTTSDNAAKAVAIVTAAEPLSNCELDCPDDVVVTVGPTSSGTNVKFGAAASRGDCGALRNNPKSGSFFAVGTTPVTSTATDPGPDGILDTADDISGPSCTFQVKVLNTPLPTVSCPANKTATAGGDGTASVSVGTPAFTPADASYVGVRSDGTPAVYDEDGNVTTPAFTPALTDPYPTGITGITWTVTDADGRQATCKQTVVVHGVCSSDTEPPTFAPTTDCPTCGAPADLTVSTGPDNTGCAVALDDELGQAVAVDDCSVTISVSGIPAGNEFPIGTTTLTYTATDPAGHAVTDTQTVTVIDNTAPHIAAPADATYVCPSQVPAANASQATRGEVLDEDGNLLPPGPPFDNCGIPTVAVTESSSGAGSAASPLVITRIFAATDSHGNSSSSVQTITVIDNTPPSVTAPINASYQCASQVPGASASQATASDNCAAPSVAVSESNNGGAGSIASPLVISRIYTATDAAGNSANATQTITVIDNTPPTVTPPANVTVYLPLNSTATSMVVNYPSPATANDNCAGTVTLGYSPASGSIFPAGTTTVTVTGTDNHNNSATATFTVTVLYNFTGFNSPVGNLPVLNVVNAGRAIPVKFSLSGNKGLNIFAVNSPYTVAINCDGSAPQADVAETTTAGGSSLSYSPDTYHYVWKTESSWAGTCRQLVVKLNDGSEHKANFKFK